MSSWTESTSRAAKKYQGIVMNESLKACINTLFNAPWAYVTLYYANDLVRDTFVNIFPSDLNRIISTNEDKTDNFMKKYLKIFSAPLNKPYKVVYRVISGIPRAARDHRAILPGTFLAIVLPFSGGFFSGRYVIAAT